MCFIYLWTLHYANKTLYQSSKEKLLMFLLVYPWHTLRNWEHIRICTNTSSVFHGLYEKSSLHFPSLREVLNNMLEKPFHQCQWLTSEYELIGLKRQNKNLEDCLLEFFFFFFFNVSLGRVCICHTRVSPEYKNSYTGP